MKAQVFLMMILIAIMSINAGCVTVQRYVNAEGQNVTMFTITGLHPAVDTYSATMAVLELTGQCEYKETERQVTKHKNLTFTYIKEPCVYKK